jgi:hypothetical protein
MVTRDHPKARSSLHHLDRLCHDLITMTFRRVSEAKLFAFFQVDAIDKGAVAG